jgi:TetR/AcrR family transcriptional regulator, cholesterol catabolism regulator
MEVKCQQMLEQVTALFMQYGVRSLTMDDIARHLGISKKTLYQCFADKAEMVEKTMAAHIDLDVAMMERINAEAPNAIEEMFLIVQHVAKHLTQIHPSVLFDLEKYYPKAYRLFIDYKHKTIRRVIERNMTDGMAQGLYRENLKPRIISGLYVGRIDVFFDRELFPPSETNPAEVYVETIRYHIRGIASEKGIAYLQDKMRTIDNSQPNIF